MLPRTPRVYQVGEFGKYRGKTHAKPHVSSWMAIVYHPLSSFHIISLQFQILSKPWVSRQSHGPRLGFFMALGGTPITWENLHFHLVGCESEDLLVQLLRGQGIFPQNPWIRRPPRRNRCVSVPYRCLEVFP